MSVGTGADREKKEVSPSVRGWQLIVLGLLSPFVAGLIASRVSGDPSSGVTEGKVAVIGLAGLAVGALLVVAGFLVLIMNLASSGARKSRSGAVPDGDNERDWEADERTPRPTNGTPSTGRPESAVTDRPTTGRQAVGVAIATAVAVLVILIWYRAQPPAFVVMLGVVAIALGIVVLKFARGTATAMTGVVGALVIAIILGALVFLLLTFAGVG